MKFCYSPDALSEPDVNAGFGDALTAALDVMAFTNDLDLSAASQPLQKSGKTQVPAPAVPVPVPIPAPSLPPAMTSTTLSVPTEAAGTEPYPMALSIFFVKLCYCAFMLCYCIFVLICHE